MNRILPLIILFFLYSCNSTSTGPEDLAPSVNTTPAPAPSPSGASPQSLEQPDESEENHVLPVRNINGTITLIWSALFPQAHAADQIHVYRFKTEREYEYISSHKVSDEGKFSINLEPSATNGYMLHLVLEEEFVKKGMRERIISGDFDQTITLDSFETIKSQIDLRWFFEQNVLRNEVFVDAASNPEDLKSVSAEDLGEIAAILDSDFAETKNWDDLTRPEAFNAFKKMLDEELSDEIVLMGKGQMNRDDFFNEIKKVKKSKNLVRFGSCALRPMDQQIITEDNIKSNDKIELRYIPLNKIAEKFLSKESRVGFEGKDELIKLMYELDVKIERFRKQVGEEIHYKLILVDKKSQSTDSCKYIF